MTGSTHHLTLTASDIADLAGVGRTTVSNWRSRHDDFPEPVAGSAASPRFDAEQVKAWLEARGRKVQGLPPDRVIWAAADRMRGLGRPEEIASVAGTLVVWRHVSDPASSAFEPKLPQASTWPGLLEHFHDHVIGHLERGMRVYEELHPEYWGAFSSRGHSSGADMQRLFQDRVEPLWSLVKAIDSLDIQELEQAYILLQDRLTTSVRRGYDVHATSEALVDLVSSAAADIPGPVHDPAVGSGRLLLAVGVRGGSRVQLTGQEIDPRAVAQALQRAIVTGRTDVKVRQGDTLTDDQFHDLKAPVVVLDPPYGLKLDDHERFYIDPRFQFGVPSRGGSDFAWPQIAIAHLAPEGRAFVILPAGTLFRGGGDMRIRMRMLQERTIEAVVALPGGMAHNTGIPLALWVLARPGETADPTSVLLIDQTRTKAPDSQGIADALRTWRTQRVVVDSDMPVRSVAVSELIASDGDLNVARWLADPVEVPDITAVRARLRDLTEALDGIQAANTRPEVAVDEGDGPAHLVTVSDLEKAGRVKFIKSIQPIRDDLHSDDGIPVISGRWIRGSDDKPLRVPLSALEREPVLTSPGDVVVSTVNTVTARVDDTGGRLLARPDHTILRVLDDTLTSQYLARALTTPRNQALMVGAAIRRVRPSDLQVPLLPLRTQDALTKHLERIGDLKALAERVAAASSEAQSALVEAITGGTVRPLLPEDHQ